MSSQETEFSAMFKELWDYADEHRPELILVSEETYQAFLDLIADIPVQEAA